MQDLSQLSLEQLQQLRQEREYEKEQIYQELQRRYNIIIAYNRGYYTGTEINAANRIEYKAEFMEMQKTYEALKKEIQEIDLLMAQYQNNKRILELLAQAFLLPIPPTKTQSTQKVLKSIESLQSFLKQDFKRPYL